MDEESNGRPDVIVEVPISEDDDDGYDEEFLRLHLTYDNDLFLDLVEEEEDGDDDGGGGGGGDQYDELWTGSEPPGEPEEEVGTEPEADASGSSPLCFRELASCGPHRVCCLPCGHVYGRSCLEKWLQRCGETAGKCPQCDRNFRQMDVINLYAPVNVVPNDSLKELCSLNEKSESLKIATIRLNGDNYLRWSQSVQIYIRGQKKIDFLSETRRHQHWRAHHMQLGMQKIQWL